MIHRALIGSPDRFMGILIEHYAGVFPLWLSPVQVKVLPISEKHNEYAESVAKELRTAEIRVEIDDRNETLGKKIRDAKTEKIPYLFVVGDKEVDSGQVSVESRSGSEGAQPLQKIIETLKEKIAARNLS